MSSFPYSFSKKNLLFWLILIFSVFYNYSFSQSPQYKLVRGKSFVQSKNYYLLTLFEELQDAKQLLSNDSLLVKITKNKIDELSQSLKNCGKSALCYTEKMKFSDDEIEVIKQRLITLYTDDNALGILVQKYLIPSGTYILFKNLPHKEMLAKAWEQDAKGINFAIGVYAEGKKPNYPNIDSFSITTNTTTNGYVSLLYNTASLLTLECESNPLFFAIPLTATLHFLEMNERNQAADFEPMEEKENKAAYARVKTIDWKKYKYSVIEVPGAGPENPEMPLSAEGMLRCRLAAIQYKKGLAPFIVTSGGKVHPYKTKFCEAIEMKKFLMYELSVPENAIIIDPHARHTTTNMRNTVRLIYRYGIPFNKPGITCTTKGQSIMISTTLIDRCLKELQETPYKNGNRLSETEVEFYPLIEALQINPFEPMDP
jgi:hypothetical protein